MASSRKASGEREPTGSECAAIVGIGASAGGLDAFERFFSAMPDDSGMSFVLIQHLDPKHESLTAQLLGRHTPMPVIEVKDRMRVDANHVYIIPPNKYLSISERELHLSEPVLRRGMRMPIDHFFRSLAEAHHDMAVGIILTGTGTDGTLGVQAIKGEGGIVLAQSPETAQYDGMPRSAIATGLVDHVGPIESMPAVVVHYNQHAIASDVDQGAASSQEEPDLLRSILAALQARTKYDFRCYKKGTLLRRISRRMGLNRIEGLRDYLELLRTNPAEANQLFKDLLIGVSGFFRESQAFEALAKVIAKIVADKSDDQPIRVWVPGCATGEEPYSIAMLISEAVQAVQKNCPIQIFATDIDQAALATARSGLYPENIAADVPPERLQRFFKREGDGFRVSKSMRDCVVFAIQNLIADPPFSKLDLVSCRNLLIYLEAEVQQKVMALFHFALSQDGCLFLGSAESIGQQEDLFEPLVKKWRLYRRLGAARHNVIEFPIFPVRHELGTARPPERPLLSDPARLGELTRGLLMQTFVPASVLVDRKYQIRYYYGETARYLNQPSGPPCEELMNRVREELRIKLRGLLHKAVQEGEKRVSGAAELREDGVTRRVHIVVTPLPASRNAEGLLIVSFEELGEAAESLPDAAAASMASGDGLVQQLERELLATREDLQSTIEEMESSNEELKAANEEVMSVNEELQSTNEELETSKEELQSLNEELSTVNSQLEEKVRELEQTNDDMDNLLSSTDIATIFLDRELRIKRYTPATIRLFNLIAGDRGRPISDISRKFEDAELYADAARVLERLVPIERDVHLSDGERWYTRRILPYRTQEDRIRGVVITFVDITERKHALDWIRLIVEAAPNAAVVVDREGRIEFLNSETEQAFGYPRQELIGKPVEILLPERFRHRHPDYRSGFFANAKARPMGEGRELYARRKDGGEFPAEIGLSPVEAEWGSFVLATITDVSERRQAADELRRARDQAEQANQAKSRFLASASHDLRQPLQTLSLLNTVLDRKVEGEALHEVVHKQRAALSSMRDMLHALVDLVRADTGSLTPELTEFPVADLLADLREEFTARAEAEGLVLRMMPCTATLRSDPVLLRQILHNLVANAIRHTEAGRVLVGCRRHGGRLRIEVWDTGPGIPADKRGTIFEHFVQLDNPAREAAKGFGLGLAVVKSLAGVLEHPLDLRSAPGRGSVFAVEVPVTDWRRAPAGEESSAEPPYRGRSGARVLVIEDDPDVLSATRFLLEGTMGLTMLPAGSLDESLTLLERGSVPDLIMADYRLPGASGIEAIQRVRGTLGREIPALLVTGDIGPEVAEEAETCGCALLNKPIEGRVLIELLTRLLLE